MNACFWKPCLFEFNWIISRISIWWCQLEIHRTGYDLCSENTKFLWRSSFLFFMRRLFSFLNFMKTLPNLAKATLRETWPWHSRSKICKITGKSGLKFWKFILCIIKQTVYRFSKIEAKGWLTQSVRTISSHINN